MIEPIVVHEDNHCLAVDKPAGWLVQADQTGDPTLTDWVKADLKARHNKPGNVFAAPAHRLDRPVSGLVLFAKTSKAASRLADQFRAGRVGKTYWAIVAGRPPLDVDRWSDRLSKDRMANVVRVVDEEDEPGALATTDIRVIERLDDSAWLELSPRTGRSHQLRVQLAVRGLPIWGDLKYGSRQQLGGRVALHAIGLEWEHPTQKTPIMAKTGLPADWPSVWRDRCLKQIGPHTPAAPSAG